MSDLISRRALIYALSDLQMGSFSENGWELEYNLLTRIIRGVESTPTAYNVDSVVAEMEEIRKVFAEGKQLYGYCIKHGDCGDTNCFDCVLTNAIEIVRKGGAV